MGIIVCSKWRFGCAVGNPASRGVIGNIPYGDDGFPRGGKPTEPDGARFTQAVASKTAINGFAVHIYAQAFQERVLTEKNSTSTDDGSREKTSAELPAVDSEPSDIVTDAASSASVSSKKTTKRRKKRNLWAIKATIATLVLSAFISFLTEITASVSNIIVTVILLLFIVMLGILFDGIGVAVTSCDITPIVSMASKKEYGAKTAMWLVKNNEKVASVCNDVVGDIISIISGSCGAAIVVKLLTILDESWQQWLSIGVSAVISALMVGGKAFLKNVAISNSKEFVMFVARVVGVFHPEERRRKKKQTEKKKKYESAAGTDDKHAKKSPDAHAAHGAENASARRKNATAEKKSIRPEKVQVARNDEPSSADVVVPRTEAAKPADSDGDNAE